MILGCEERNGYRFVDLFCGAGGATEGMKQAGFTPVRAHDNNPVCVETYNANHGLRVAWWSDLAQTYPDRPWRPLCCLVVAPDLQGQGIGTRLLREAEE